VGRYLRKIRAKPQVMFTSPLERTLQTAEIIQSFFPGLKIEADNLLIEGDLDWQGKRKIDLIKTGIWQIYLDKPSLIETGEGFLGLQKRAIKWFKKFLEKTTYKEAVVISHQDIIRSLTLFLEKRSLDDLNKVPAAMASVTIIEVDQKGKLLSPIIYWESDID
jgi:broad specificity phosphatase PhoE